jgi:hypothetical protein
MAASLLADGSGRRRERLTWPAERCLTSRGARRGCRCRMKLLELAGAKARHTASGCRPWARARPRRRMLCARLRACIGGCHRAHACCCAQVSTEAGDELRPGSPVRGSIGGDMEASIAPRAKHVAAVELARRRRAEATFESCCAIGDSG